MDAVGFPEFILRTENLAEVVAVPPSVKSCVTIFGERTPEIDCHRFTPAEVSHAPQEGLVAPDNKHRFAVEVAPTLVKTPFALLSANNTLLFALAYPGRLIVCPLLPRVNVVPVVPAMVRVPDALVSIAPPPCTNIFPFTSRAAPGVVVPIPTLP